MIGQSYGGGVALQFAYQFPERCERLALVDAGGLGREVSWLLRLVTLPGAEYVLPALFLAPVRDWGNSILSFLKDRGVRSERASEMWRSFGSLTHPSNRAAFVRTMRAVIEPGGQAVSAMDRLYLARGDAHSSSFGETRTRIIPVSHAYQTHDAIPQSRLEILPGVGHFPHVEDPFRFVEILVDFLHSTEPSSYRPEMRRAELLRRATTS